MNELVRATLSAWLALSEGDRTSFATILTTLGALPSHDGSAIVAGDAVVPAVERTQAMAARRHHRERDRGFDAAWLAVDAKGIPRIDPALFGSAAYRDRFRAGAYTNAYIAGCEGLGHLARRLKRPTFKAGTCIFERATARMATLGESRYGCAWRSEHEIVIDPGFDRWQLLILPVGLERPPGSPVEIARRTFDVGLPEGLSPQAFDRALADALAPWSLSVFMESEVGRRHRGDLDLEPRRFQRLTPDRRRGEVSYVAAQELVMMEPRHEAEDVAAVIEAIIAKFVMGRSR